MKNIQGYVFCGLMILLLCGSAIGAYHNTVNGVGTTDLITQSYMKYGYVPPMIADTEIDRAIVNVQK